MKIVRSLILFAGVVLLWQLIVILTGAPHYILPGPMSVALAFEENSHTLFHHLATTLTEMIAGLFIGTVMGITFSVTMILSPLFKRWVLPLLIISQAVPVFAMAPILVLWLGYGMASKIAMAVLIIFFPVATALFDGMQRTDPDLLTLARTMDAHPLLTLRHIVIPSSLPAFASGVRVATAVAPIGAVVGEWVGSSNGLGFYMLHANARMQIDLMFAALALLSLTSLLLYFLVDTLLGKLIFWDKKKEFSNETFF